MRVAKIGTEFITKVFSKVLNEREAHEMVVTTAQELRAEGIAEGEAKALLKVLRTKFKKIPLEIERAVHRDKFAFLCFKSGGFSFWLRPCTICCVEKITIDHSYTV